MRSRLARHLVRLKAVLHVTSILHQVQRHRYTTRMANGLVPNTPPQVLPVKTVICTKSLSGLILPTTPRPKQALACLYSCPQRRYQ